MENSFNSMDRLLEFGMSMAVAQQMMNTMNHAMNSMQVPGAGNPMITPAAPKFHAYVNGAVAGPLELDEIQKLIENKHINEDTLVWKPGSAGWVMAKNMPEINKLILLTNPAQE